jgi:hypothetical protein
MTMWGRTPGGRWVAIDPETREPITGARSYEQVPVRAGDQMSAEDAARLMGQTGEAPLSERVEHAKEGLYGGQEVPGVGERVRAAKAALGL